MHRCRQNDYTTEINVWSKFSFTIILLMFFPISSKFFTNILKIYELLKINNTMSKYCQTLV